MEEVLQYSIKFYLATCAPKSARSIGTALIRLPDGAPAHVTLASYLGPDPAVYVSTSHGVEFETQAGSVSAGSEVHGPVTVSPCLQIVDFPAEGLSR